jgi:hypothetical protein
LKLLYLVLNLPLMIIRSKSMGGETSAHCVSVSV